MHLEDYNWYAKNIASAAAAYGQNQTAHAESRFTIHSSIVGGSVLVVDTSIAPIFLAAVTLITSIALPLLFIRSSKFLAVISSAMRDVKNRKFAEIGLQPTAVPTHLPVMLANGGLWLSDAWAGFMLLVRHLRAKEWKVSLLYLAFFSFSFTALLIGPFAAFLISRRVVSGFGGSLDGPCIHQYNFTVNATNIISPGIDHHGRAIELLPWLSSFNYPWSSNISDEYLSGKSIIDPTSRANYTRLAGCVLKDDVLCDDRFPHTHMVSGELTSPQFGLWSQNNWKFSMESFCLRLNSTAISRYSPRDGWLYHLSFAPGSSNVSDVFTEYTLGQGETQRYERKKNIITNSYFNNDPSQTEWAHELWRPSLRDLDIHQLAVITILPPTEPINQDVNDDIYSAPVAVNDFDFRPSQMVHILCWDKLFISVDGIKVKTSLDWLNRTNFVLQNGLPLSVEPLIGMADSEFIIKPLRYLRDNTLLQYLSDDPVFEYNATLAPAIPFGAEMHRWGHIGIMDIASKPTRTVTGYYARGIPQNSSSIASIQSPHLHELCQSIRTAKEGSISIPLWIVLILYAILVVVLFWWLLEIILTALAQAGYPGVIRAFLILPATRPTALSTSVALALEGADLRNIKHSASGWPELMGEDKVEMGASLIQVPGGWALTWSPGWTGPAQKIKIL